MAIDLTRFYYDFDDDCRTGCLLNLAFEDVERKEADQFERDLKEKEISYLRVDL